MTDCTGKELLRHLQSGFISLQLLQDWGECATQTSGLYLMFGGVFSRIVAHALLVNAGLGVNVASPG